MHILSAEEETRQMDGQTDNKAGSENKSIYRKQTDRSIDVDTTKSLNWKFEAFEAKPNEHTRTHIHTYTVLFYQHTYTCTKPSKLYAGCMLGTDTSMLAFTHPPAHLPTHACMHACLHLHVATCFAACLKQAM